MTKYQFQRPVKSITQRVTLKADHTAVLEPAIALINNSMQEAVDNVYKKKQELAEDIRLSDAGRNADLIQFTKNELDRIDKARVRIQNKLIEREQVLKMSIYRKKADGMKLLPDARGALIAQALREMSSADRTKVVMNALESGDPRDADIILAIFAYPSFVTGLNNPVARNMMENKMSQRFAAEEYEMLADVNDAIKALDTGYSWASNEIAVQLKAASKKTPKQLKEEREATSAEKSAFLKEHGLEEFMNKSTIGQLVFQEAEGQRGVNILESNWA